MLRHGQYILRNKSTTGIFPETMVCFSNLEDLLRHYRNEVTPHKRRSHPEACRINKIIRNDIARLSLKELSTIHIARYRTKRLKELSKATIRKELQILPHALDLARKEWGLNKANVVRDIRKPIDQTAGKEDWNRKNKRYYWRSCRSQ